MTSSLAIIVSGLDGNQAESLRVVSSTHCRRASGLGAVGARRTDLYCNQLHNNNADSLCGRMKNSLELGFRKVRVLVLISEISSEIRGSD